MLKKDGSFPLEKPCALALYGSGARRTVKGGTGSGEVNSRTFVTAEAGLEAAGFTVTTKPWLEHYGALWLAPALNLHRDLRCGRNFEYFSEDPLLSGSFAAAITRGVQAHPGCGVTVKHFAANNQETNRYSSNSQVSERALRELYLLGFEIAVREGRPHAPMSSYNLINGVHSSERRDLIQDVLRAEFGFASIVMTDWILSSMYYGKHKYLAPNAARIAAAGNDLVMPGGKGDMKAMLEGLKAGLVTREQLEINATRVVKMARTLATPDGDREAGRG